MRGLKGNAMIRFESDYAEGAHESILRRLLETNLEQTPGYGTDTHCENARALIQNTDLSARDIAEKALHIAASICVYTNDHIIVEDV